MKPFLTLRAGGPARRFTTVRSVDDVSAAVRFAKTAGLPWFVLGGGSNTLVSDRGYDGLVIKMEGAHLEECEVGGRTLVTASAGTPWDTLVAWTTDRGLWGLENLSYIPGSVGASPVQNVGAYGVDAGMVIRSVDVFDTLREKVEVLDVSELALGYRDSMFKHHDGSHLIVLTVTFSLSRVGEPNIIYAGLREQLPEPAVGCSLTPRDVRDAVIRVRRAKLPEVTDVGTAGSFFKNPLVTIDVHRALEATWGAIPHFPTEVPGTVKLPAAWLLDHIGGWKGYREDHVGVHDTQALVIVHDGLGLASDIDALARRMQSDIETRTGIVLEREPVSIGF